MARPMHHPTIAMRGRPPVLSLVTFLGMLVAAPGAMAQAELGSPPAETREATDGAERASIRADGDATVEGHTQQRLLRNRLETSDLTTEAAVEGSFVRAAGVVLINQAPSSLVNQANVVVIGATGGGRDVAVALTAAEQEIRDNRVEQRGGRHETRISEGSFSGATGYVGVNQSAGPLQNQLNLVVFAVSPDVAVSIADEDLGQVSAGNRVSADLVAARSDRIDAGSFEGFKGIVQIHQSSGANVNAANLMAVGTDMNALGLGVFDP